MRIADTEDIIDDDEPMTEEDRLWQRYLNAIAEYNRVSASRSKIVRSKLATLAQIDEANQQANAASHIALIALRDWRRSTAQSFRETQRKQTERRKPGAKPGQRRKMLTEEMRQHILRDYLQGVGHHDLAAKHGRHISSIHRLLREARKAGDIPHTKQSLMYATKNRRPIFKHIIDYRLDHPDATTAQVAEVVGAAITTVRSATTRAYEAGYRVDEVREAFSRFARSEC